MARKAGRGDPIITKEKLQKYLGGLSPPLAGTTQIADHFDVRRPSAIERLDTFEDEGIVGKREVGQSFAWYLMDWKVVVEADSGGGYDGYRSESESEEDTVEGKMQADALNSGLPALVERLWKPLLQESRVPYWLYAWTVVLGVSPILLLSPYSNPEIATAVQLILGLGGAAIMMSAVVGLMFVIGGVLDRLSSESMEADR